MCLFLVIACCFDYRTQKIPNVLILCCLITGIVYRLSAEGYVGILEYLTSALLTIGMFYFFFWIGAMGAGDVKILGVCAGFFPWNKVLYFVFFALLTMFYANGK